MTITMTSTEIRADVVLKTHTNLISEYIFVHINITYYAIAIVRRLGTSYQ